ncbi:hypothetical protein [Megalodesulfovibrio gigas]|uniref:Uncharacterized protein n=1 Tax=Megalodesulfovibrio gigas (strain ATCC 19364 / DSM 1382 / NCIMB 9332 / VKM B-1759) TaxID=1121448 RepID=T2GFH9_MEGG1|nr:hypothetical protein [Megalodesulfovibrio gigas]AGW14652.1 hypothetical protein DGI_2927 [Megalodesulfovibrio gigas DSM 1382 = ATCC 19364]
MGSVIELQAFKNARTHAIQEAHLANLRAAPSGETGVTDKDIWTLDYTSLAGMVRGVANVRRILDVHLHFNEEWKFHLLDVLESLTAAHLGNEGRAVRPVSDAVASCKGSLSEDLTVANRGDLLRAMVILDLLDAGAQQAAQAVSHVLDPRH